MLRIYIEFCKRIEFKGFYKKINTYSDKSLPFVSGRVSRTKKAHIANIEATIKALPLPIISPLNKKAKDLTATNANSGGAIAQAPLPTL